MIQQDCVEQIRQAKENIEKRKEILLQKSEKELLTDVMIALDGYGGRFERIEKILTDDQIAEKISQLMQQMTSQINNVTGTLISRIDTMKSFFESSINDSDLLRSINNLNSNMLNISSDIDDIKNSVYDRYGYDDIAYIVDEVKSDVNSMKYTVDGIYSSVSNQYSYDFLASNIDSIKSAIDEAKDAAEGARYAAENARYAIESHY